MIRRPPRSTRTYTLCPDTALFRAPAACFQLLERLDTFLEGIAGQWRQQEGHKLKVLVLWRYNLLDPFGGQIPRFSNIEVTGLSFHRPTGLEANYTVLLAVSDGDYEIGKAHVCTPATNAHLVCGHLLDKQQTPNRT